VHGKKTQNQPSSNLNTASSSSGNPGSKKQNPALVDLYIYPGNDSYNDKAQMRNQKLA